MEITDHLLDGENITRQNSPNHSGVMADGVPDSVVIHYTAGGSLEGAVRTLCDPERSASAHVVVGREGEIVQLVPFNTIAWHAGKSSHQGRESFNQFSVGIEIDNAGQLTKTEQGFSSWFGRNYSEEEVIHAVHQNRTEPDYWQKYSEEQIAAVFDLCTLLMQTYPIELIVGHEEISPSRKIDPGPAFPLDKLRERLLVKDRAEEGPDRLADSGLVPGRTGIVTASRLNIRSEPGLRGRKVAPALQQGTVLDILEEKDGWLRVDVQTRGWVKKDYVNL
ncbi:MAG: N-acetylmuramoyl-L-alanine amidase [Candidatus Marinimicrobia bacterium]|nr:N-acetylmuramoyl-L-alanine amidase [Candidatus Neomarinimicrobiota bacterium]MCF7829388.1 N-acetylmuramoyl-L-alanine amidase [Candidatus Neomarinimicrobiota bacterium]MCF7880874.1 N-acetylmuramoyl-L-alanine amidase [Candidatus Neomarinimicrobiota bacterium]